MSVMDTTTRHNPRQERDFARILYMAIAAAVLLGMVFFIIIGGSKSLNPLDDRRAEAPVASPVAPDTTAKPQGR
jgi:hypothetical protein